MDKNVIIIGGGIAGLLAAIQLQTQDIPCLIIEKKRYPFHRVCGEYISNEAKPFLQKLTVFPEELSPSSITKLQLSSGSGASTMIPLDLGGFGISRFAYDHFLYQYATNVGVQFLFEEANEISFTENQFSVALRDKQFSAKVVLCAYGKRSLLDVKLQRKHISKRSPFVGVKYHIKTDHQPNVIGLHNFTGGYCGISNVEAGVTNLCYLASSKKLKERGTIEAFEKNVLFQNPILKSIFLNADFLFDKPEVISEISFATKTPLEKHMLMIGDAAGMITPLCGNGMAMAIHSSKIASEWVVKFLQNKIDREKMERGYANEWTHQFKTRLQTGRYVQQLLFGAPFAAEFSTRVISKVGPLRNIIIRQTHGTPF